MMNGMKKQEGVSSAAHRHSLIFLRREEEEEFHLGLFIFCSSGETS